ncbi:MAG: hypothetical protein PUI83_01610, partial [Dialister sp.]|nr:hypothetical protein [Dialister sp.]
DPPPPSAQYPYGTAEESGRHHEGRAGRRINRMQKAEMRFAHLGFFVVWFRVSPWGVLPLDYV